MRIVATLFQRAGSLLSCIEGTHDPRRRQPLNKLNLSLKGMFSKKHCSNIYKASLNGPVFKSLPWTESLTSLICCLRKHQGAHKSKKDYSFEKKASHLGGFFYGRGFRRLES